MSIDLVQAALRAEELARREQAFQRMLERNAARGGHATAMSLGLARARAQGATTPPVANSKNAVAWLFLPSA